MDKIVINGGRRLHGRVEISGAKNAVLPMMAASLLAPGKYTIENCPDLRDVKTMSHLLRIIGAKVELSDHTLNIDTESSNFFEAPYELVKTMRASIYVLGPLLARHGQARVSLPGGCAWGPRPVDLHLKGLARMGASIELEGGYVIARARRLKGSRLNFDISSVGATANLLMAATLAEGTTVIENAAQEPEIEALSRFLINMGARIEGVGTRRLVVQGVDNLAPTTMENIPDRIEAGTFLIAGAITRGEVELEGAEPDHLSALLAKLEEAGAGVEIEGKKVGLKVEKRLQSVDITTAIYPGFPTDLQAQWMALMALADRSCLVTDTVFLDRFTHVAELKRLGADIRMDKNTALVTGREKLKGAPVMSTDLRASASLILAGLAAEGRTDVSRVYHIDRGYEKIEEKLKALGADIRREGETS